MSGHGVERPRFGLLGVLQPVSLQLLVLGNPDGLLLLRHCNVHLYLPLQWLWLLLLLLHLLLLRRRRRLRLFDHLFGRLGHLGYCFFLTFGFRCLEYLDLRRGVCHRDFIDQRLVRTSGRLNSGYKFYFRYQGWAELFKYLS